MVLAIANGVLNSQYLLRKYLEASEIARCLLCTRTACLKPGLPDIWQKKIGIANVFSKKAGHVLLKQTCHFPPPPQFFFPNIYDINFLCQEEPRKP